MFHDMFHCFQGTNKRLCELMITGLAGGAPSPPLNSNAQRDLEDYSSVPAAGHGSDDP